MTQIVQNVDLVTRMASYLNKESEHHLTGVNPLRVVVIDVSLLLPINFVRIHNASLSGKNGDIAGILVRLHALVMGLVN